jgi:hypothetical protein
MMKHKVFLFLNISLLLMMNACAPTVEGELNEYTDFQASMIELKSEYPKFSEAISEAESIMATKWEEAGKVAVEEEKAEAMSAVNDEIKSSCVYYLQQIPVLINAVDAGIAKFDNRSMQSGLFRKVEKARNKALQNVRSAEDALEGSAGTMAEANTLLATHFSNLKSSKMKLSSLWSEYKKSKKKKKKKKVY